MREGGHILAEIVQDLVAYARVDMTTMDIENHSIHLLKSFEKYDIAPAFKNYKGYLFNGCYSVNDCIIHGIPNLKTLNTGDLLKIDFGIIYKGLYTDHAESLVVGNPERSDPKYASIYKIKDCCDKCREFVIANIRPGISNIDISRMIDKYATDNGYWPYFDAVGHSVGKELHEERFDIYNFSPRKFGLKVEEYEVLKDMTITIEPQFSEKSGFSYIDKVDKQSVMIEGGGLSIMCEHTIAITDTGAEILSK